MNESNFKDLAIKSFNNAVELLEEARLLFKNKHYSRAIFLSQIGGEELGKHIMSTSAYVNFHTGKFNEKKFKFRFFAHREKTKTINIFEDFFLDALNDTNHSDEELKNKFTQYAPNADTEEKGKLLSLYVDVVDGIVLMPSEIMDKELAELTINTLRNRIKLFSKLGTIKILTNEKALKAVLEKTIKELEKYKKNREFM